MSRLHVTEAVGFTDRYVSFPDICQYGDELGSGQLCQRSKGVFVHSLYRFVCVAELHGIRIPGGAVHVLEGEHTLHRNGSSRYNSAHYDRNRK